MTCTKIIKPLRSKLDLHFIRKGVCVGNNTYQFTGSINALFRYFKEEQMEDEYLELQELIKKTHLKYPVINIEIRTRKLT